MLRPCHFVILNASRFMHLQVFVPFDFFFFFTATTCKMLINLFIYFVRRGGGGECAFALIAVAVMRV